MYIMYTALYGFYYLRVATITKQLDSKRSSFVSCCDVRAER